MNNCLQAAVNASVNGDWHLTMPDLNPAGVH